MDDLAFNQKIAAFLAVCKTASLATVNPAGEPCNANIQYVNDDAWRLYWVSNASSVHSLNLVEKPDAAVTIYSHLDDQDLIHGLQMRGKAEVLEGAEAEDALKRYTEKYPFVSEPPFDKAVANQDFYRFTPTWLRWLDNREGFGWKREITL